ncbi:hypothetical protein [Saccharopolyspora sp. ASAGF58]|uniref:hypothetical protein n=1 Tax=Saccharopolyspora sp. ASAGF58 TaxID=2719023 RepID=UPI001B30F41B|nr:hypothetical protein [Saccharopolyspora sp. ASAGF58]
MTPPRQCGVCGEHRPIVVRAGDGKPDTCERCYRNLGDCVTCGRHRDGSVLDGRFYCATCYPGTQSPCAICGHTKRVKANWPLGPVCATCRQRRGRAPAPCGHCGTTRVLVGRDDRGTDICGPCAGHPSLDFTCRRCGHPGDIYADGCCTRCVVAERLAELFDRGDGTVAPRLQPLLKVLKSANPWSVLNWLRRNTSTLLAEFAARPDALTHATLDALPQDQVTRFTRATLVVAGVLPDRHEQFAQLRLWADNTLRELPPRQQRILRPFAEWDVLRAARRRTARGRYTENAAAGDRAEIRAAIMFLTWLDDHDLQLHDVTSAHLERWLELHPTRAKALRAFLCWTHARHLTVKLTTTSPGRWLPSQFLTDDEHYQQLRRCLTERPCPWTYASPAPSSGSTHCRAPASSNSPVASSTATASTPTSRSPSTRYCCHHR